MLDTEEHTDGATIKVEFGSTNLDVTLTPNKQFVIALVAFLNVEIPKLYDDATVQKLAGFTDRLTKSSEALEAATHQPQGE